jgi:hypothetical protein
MTGDDVFAWVREGDGDALLAAVNFAAGEVALAPLAAGEAVLVRV